MASKVDKNVNKRTKKQRAKRFRETWNLNPVTKVVPNKKKYFFKKEEIKQEFWEEVSNI